MTFDAVSKTDDGNGDMVLLARYANLGLQIGLELNYEDQTPLVGTI